MSPAYKGIPYDGNITKAEGKGTWWEGLDPQAIYAQNHKPCTAWGREWQKGIFTPPSQEYCEKFYNRTSAWQTCSYIGDWHYNRWRYNAKKDIRFNQKRKYLICYGNGCTTSYVSIKSFGNNNEKSK